MSFKSLLSLLFILLIGEYSYSQYGGGRPSGGGGPWGSPKVTVTGNVTDASTGAPLEYASVSFYKTEDSSLITGVVTNSGGKFEAEVSAKSYFVKIYFLGYIDKTIGPVTPESGIALIPMGDIQVEPSVTNLDEVTVQARKSTMELRLDKRVFNVGSDLSTAGGNALQVLEAVPSIEVDIDGNISLRGSGNVRILIDGKPSGLIGLSSVDALRFLQSDQIEKVEIVTNPSAKYDAEGNSGIINIILKKDKKKGLNGSVTTTVGVPHNYGLTGTLNYRTKKLNFFTSYGFNYRQRPGSGYYFQQSLSGDSIIIFEREREHERGGFGNNLRAGLTYRLNATNSLSLSGSFFRDNGDNFASNIYFDRDEDLNLLNQTTRIDNEDEQGKNYEIDLSYEKTFQEKGRKWTIDGKYIARTDRERSEITEASTNNPFDTLFQRVFNDENQSRWLFQTDYVHPFSKNVNFETGFRANLRDIRNNYAVEQLENENWEVLDEFDDSLQYVENVIAAYVQAGHQVDWFSYQLGLRMEHTHIETEAASEGIRNTKNYVDFFPSVFLSFDAGKGNTFQISYSRRLSRPWFRQLLPFTGFSDNRSLWVGNPDLNPEYTHSMEISYLKEFENASVLVSPYYRYSTGVMNRVTIVDSLGNSFTQSINLSDQHAMGFELNYNHTLTKWWDLTLTMNLYYSILNGEYEGRDLGAETWSGSGRMIFKFHMPWDMDFQMTGSMSAPKNTSQGFQEGIYALDLSLSQKLLKNKAILSLNLRDVFNTRRWRSELDQPDFQRTSEFQWASRQFNVSFSYYFNQKPRMGYGVGGGGMPMGGEGF